MTIEIHEPELEALIERRMASGEFQSVEDFLLRTLQASPGTQEPPAIRPQKENLTQFLKASPLWGSDLVIDRSKDAWRRVDL
jgi:hypothetical protein